MLNYDITRMKERATFETVKSRQTPMGVNIETPVPVTTVWCGEYSNSQQQTYDNLGTHIQVDLVLIIRHNPNIKQSYKVKYKDQQYEIVNINRDDRLNAFDLITLKQYHGLPKA